MSDYPVELLKSMLETYSPSGSEEQVAALLHDEMQSHGFRVTIDSAGNVIGCLGRDGPRLLLCGHMDTVPGEIPVRIKEDTIYGRGAVDAKSSLAAMLAGTILANEKCTLPCRVTVAGVVEEETTSAGIRTLMNGGANYDLAVFGEPSGSSNLIIGYKGSLQAKVICRTEAGHSASPWLFKNSAEEAFEFWKLIKGSLLSNDASSKFSSLTGSLTQFQSGRIPNSIPSKAEMNLDFRIPPGTRPAQIFERVVTLAHEYEQAHSDVSLEAALVDQVEPVLAARNSIAVRMFRLAIRLVIGGEVQLKKKTGTSDMNLLAQHHEIPMIAYGPGDSHLDHTANERVSINEYLNAVTVYSKAIERATVIDQKTSVLTT